MLSIKKVLMDRDGLSEEAADRLMREGRRELESRLNGFGGDPSDVCIEYFGVEDDYVYDLMKVKDWRF